MTAMLLPPVALSALASLVLALDWWDSGIAPWVTEGLVASLVAVGPLALALLALAYAVATRRIWRMLKAIGVPVLNYHLIQEEESPACPCGPGVGGIVGCGSAGVGGAC